MEHGLHSMRNQLVCAYVAVCAVITEYQRITRRSRYRALTAAALRYDGLLFADIAQQMGVTTETARQAVLKGERLLVRDYASLNWCARHVNSGGSIPA